MEDFDMFIILLPRITCTLSSLPNPRGELVSQEEFQKHENVEYML